MGKVIRVDLKDNDLIFTTGWSIATVRRLSKKDKNSKKNKKVVKDNTEEL